MKLNATSEMIPVTWPEFAEFHPFAPADQLAGYTELIALLKPGWLAQITGFDAISHAAQRRLAGEYAGLLAIRGLARVAGEVTATSA